MKPSYFVTPRTMADGHWSYNADPIIRFNEPESRVERAAGFVLAVVLGVIFAMLAFHWLAK